MVSIGQNLAFRAAQLNSTQKTVKTEENTAENNTVANQAALNTSEGNAKTIMPSTELLLVNNGIKINKPNGEENAKMTAEAKHIPFPSRADLDKALANGELSVGDTCYVQTRNGYAVYIVTSTEDGRLQASHMGTDKTSPYSS